MDLCYCYRPIGLLIFVFSFLIHGGALAGEVFTFTGKSSHNYARTGLYHVGFDDYRSWRGRLDIQITLRYEMKLNDLVPLDVLVSARSFMPVITET